MKPGEKATITLADMTYIVHDDITTKLMAAWAEAKGGYEKSSFSPFNTSPVSEADWLDWVYDQLGPQPAVAIYGLHRRCRMDNTSTKWSKDEPTRGWRGRYIEAFRSRNQEVVRRTLADAREELHRLAYLAKIRAALDKGSAVAAGKLPPGGGEPRPA